MTRTLQLKTYDTYKRSPEELANTVKFLKVMADEHRVAIILHLAEGAKTVSQIQEVTGLSQARASHHIGLLREAGIILQTPQGRSNLYSLCCAQIAEPVKWLATLASIKPEGVAMCEKEVSNVA